MSTAYAKLASQTSDEFELAYLQAADVFCESAQADADTPLMTIDPATILIIIKALQVLVPWMRDKCGYSSRDAMHYASQLNIIDRWRISSKLRGQLGTNEWKRLGGRRSVNHLQAVAKSSQAESLMSTMWAGQPLNGTFVKGTS